jgi:hypothetical protein
MRKNFQMTFLPDGLLADVVLEHNRAHPLNQAFDASSEFMMIKPGVWSFRVK